MRWLSRWGESRGMRVYLNCGAKNRLRHRIWNGDLEIPNHPDKRLCSLPLKSLKCHSIGWLQHRKLSTSFFQSSLSISGKSRLLQPHLCQVSWTQLSLCISGVLGTNLPPSTKQTSIFTAFPSATLSQRWYVPLWMTTSPRKLQHEEFV